MVDISEIASRNLVCAPITALCFIKPSLLLAAQGPSLKLFRVSGTSKINDPLCELAVLSLHRIHVIVHDEDSNRVLVAGGKEAALVAVDTTNSRLSVQAYWKANDWILTGCFLGSSEILLVTSHNSVLHYAVKEDQASLMQEIPCQERPLLWSACFSERRYANPQDVYLAVGTIMNEVLVWAPFGNAASAIERRLQGHDGSIFFVSFAPDSSAENGWMLASGSDDRSVRLWHWRRESDHVDKALLWGHSHRPWRACWSENGQELFTVGEDLRCLLWQRPQDLPALEKPLKPAHEWTGHEGKNLWSVAQSSGIVTTGGADGALRLWQAAHEDSLTLYEAPGKDSIASFRAWQDHLILVLKNGDVYYRYKAFGKLDKIVTLAKPSTQVHICLAALEGGRTLALVASRQGDIAVLQLKEKGQMAESQLGYSVMAMDVRVVQNVLYLAVFDRQVQKLVVYYMDNQIQRFNVHASSPAIETERNPTLLYWLDDQTLLLADHIASIWIYRLSTASSEPTTAQMKLLYLGRLPMRGTHCITPDSTAGDLCFSVGNQDQCITYQLVEKAEAWQVEPIAIDCLGHGRVSQILDTPSGRQYMCCTISRASIIDKAGDTLATVYPPSSMSQSLQVVWSAEGYAFYSMLTKSLHLQSYVISVPPILQSGLHGKEIHCIALHQFDGIHDTILAATGSEEGVLKISLVHPESLAFKPLFRLRDATLEGAGAVGSVCWASTSDPNVALLFVTAAQGALYCLRVSLLENQQIRVWRYPSAPMSKGEGEICRIVALDILRSHETDSNYEALAGYANGTVKMWRFCQTDGSWSTSWSSSWHDRCILSVKLCLVDGEPVVLTGATDGRLAIWKMSGQHSSRSVEPSLVLDHTHQSGVNVVGAQYQNGQISIISGGDDNSIVYEKISAGHRDLPRDSTTLRQLSGHASSIKGIAWLDETRFVTSSTDQRVILWKVDPDAGRIEKVRTAVSHVADVGCLHALLLRDGRIVVSVCGMGVEVFAVNA